MEARAWGLRLGARAKAEGKESGMEAGGQGLVGQGLNPL